MRVGQVPVRGSSMCDISALGSRGTQGRERRPVAGALIPRRLWRAAAPGSLSEAGMELWVLLEVWCFYLRFMG